MKGKINSLVRWVQKNLKSISILAVACFVLLFAFAAESCKQPVDNKPHLSKNADLQSLTVSEGTLRPAFNPDTTEYTVSVPNAAESITITALKADSGATISTTSGLENRQLNEGNNAITITVSAASGKVKTYTVTVKRLTAGNPVEGATLAEKLAWLQANAEDDTEYTIEVSDDETIGPQTLFNTERSDIAVRLISTGGERIISLGSNGSLFTIGSGVTLILDDGITLKGLDGNTSPLVQIDDNGELYMREGARITGNTDIRYYINDHGGGVYIGENGTFTMSGGEISGNTASRDQGGGVYIGENGTFTMSGGEISGNTASRDQGGFGGGGVYMSGNGTFTMSGGEISGNTSDFGGGVYMSDNGTFTMSGGEISGNTSPTGGGVYMFDNGTLTMSGGEISGNTASYYGGGVYMSDNGTLTMSGGEISGNAVSGVYSDFGGGVYMSGNGTLTMSGGEISDNTCYYGGGVTMSGTFTMSGGEISGNTASGDRGGGVYVGGTFIMNDGTVSGNSGGGVYVVGTFTMNDGTVSGNTSSHSGGGVFVEYFSGENYGTFTMSGGEISDNTCSNSGGGVMVWAVTSTMSGGKISGNTSGSGGGVIVEYGGHNGSFTMTGGTISGNTANGGGTPLGLVNGSGGGVYLGVSGTFTMSGGEISDNTCSGSGGGVFVECPEEYNSSFTMMGGTISGNTASGYGGGVYMWNGTFHITEGTIYGQNEPDADLRNTSSPGAALFSDGGSVQYGVFSDPPGNTNWNGTDILLAGDESIKYSDNTIRVVNGVLLEGGLDIGTVTINNTTPRVGDTLTAVYHPGDGTGTPSWRWLRDDAIIPGAANSTYTVVSADVGSSLKASVSYSNIGSVSSDATNVVASARTVTLYSVGDYDLSPSGIGSCYWQGTTRTVTSTMSSDSRAITVSGGTVYTAGSYASGVNNNVPCYWQGTARTDLYIPYGTRGGAVAIAVAGGMVYTAGAYQVIDPSNPYDVSSSYQACYWQGTTKTDLSIPAGADSQTVAITAAGGTVYTAGYYNESGDSLTKACYWQGSTKFDLEIPSDATYSTTTAISVANGTVYIAGHYTEGGVTKACYWQNTTRTDLPFPAGAKSTSATAITVSDGTVYTAGSYFDESSAIQGCYWQGQIVTELLLPAGAGYGNENTINAIAVAGGTAFIAGSYRGDIGVYVCYWRGTTRIDIGTIAAYPVNVYTPATQCLVVDE